MELDDVTTLCLVAFLASSVTLDLTSRRIPNALTASGFLLALALRAPLGVEAVGAGVLGAGIGFLFALPWFLAGGLGGGDVKLLSAVGAFLGPLPLLLAIVVMALTGALLSLVVVARRGALLETLANVALIVLTLGRRTFTGWRGAGSEAPFTLRSPGALSVPYGVAIAVGGLAGWFLA